MAPVRPTLLATHSFAAAGACHSQLRLAYLARVRPTLLALRYKVAPDTPGLDAVPALGAGRLRDSCALLVSTARSDPGALVERGVQLFLTASALLQVRMSALKEVDSEALVDEAPCYFTGRLGP